MLKFTFGDISNALISSRITGLYLSPPIKSGLPKIILYKLYSGFKLIIEVLYTMLVMLLMLEPYCVFSKSVS